MPDASSRSHRHWLAAEGGATAVEFALIAVPFLTLLFAIIELGMIFVASTTIESATATAARQIRTGQLQASANNNAAAFKALICNRMTWISTAECTANLSVDVRTFSTFSAIDATPPVAGGAIDQSKLTFNSGAPCDIVLVRAFYPWTLLVPVLEPGLPDINPTQRLLATTVAFRNEDWQANAQGCA